MEVEVVSGICEVSGSVVCGDELLPVTSLVESVLIK